MYSIVVTITDKDLRHGDAGMIKVVYGFTNVF